MKNKLIILFLTVNAVTCAEELYPLAPSTSSFSAKDLSESGFSTEFTGSTDIHSSFSSLASTSHESHFSFSGTASFHDLHTSSSEIKMEDKRPLSDPPSTSISKIITPTRMFSHSDSHLPSSSTAKLADHFLGVKAPRANVEPSNNDQNRAIGPYTQESVLDNLSVESLPHQGEARQVPDVTNILKGLLNVVGEGLSIATNYVKEENRRKASLSSAASSNSAIQHSVSTQFPIVRPTVTRPTRPPRPSRINNRGPPRLTEIPFESIPLEVLAKPKPGKNPLVKIPQRPFKYGPHLIGGNGNDFTGGVPLPQLLIPEIDTNKNKDAKKKKKIKFKNPNLIRPTRIPISHLHHTFSLPQQPSTLEKIDTSSTIEATISSTMEFSISKTTTTSIIKTTTSTTQKPTVSVIFQSVATTTKSNYQLSATSQKTPPLPPLTFVPSVTTTKRPAIIKSQTSVTSRPNGRPYGPKNTTPKTPPQIPEVLHHIPAPGLVIDPYATKKGNEAYPEIINITLTADQSFGNVGGVVNVPLYGRPAILTYAPGQDDQFVSIDGQKTYFDIGGTSTQAENIYPTRPLRPQYPIATTKRAGYVENIGSAEVVAQNEVKLPLPNVPKQRLFKKGPTRRPNAPPIRIDTCIVGEEGTCDKDKHEVCKVFLGVSSCFCKPGYGRRNHRQPCKKTVKLLMSLQVDRINNNRIFWSNHYENPNSEEYQLLEGESNYAIDTSMALTSFSTAYIGNTVNRFFSLNGKVTVNITLEMFQSPYTTSPVIKRDIQHKLIQVIQARNSNIGNGNLYVDGPLNPIPGVADLDECTEPEMNDCSERATCINKFGTYTCRCKKGYGDHFEDDEDRRGRYCQSCSADNCSGRGFCSIQDGAKICECKGNYYGSSCEIDGDVLAVAIGASVTAVVIIVLTLVCLCLWSRKWRREGEKGFAASAIYSTPTYSPGNPGNNSIYQQPTMHHQIAPQYPRRLPPPPPATGPPPPQLHSPDLGERLRWMHDVLNQQNVYAQLHQQQQSQLPPTPSQFTTNNMYSVPVNNAYVHDEGIYGTLPRGYNQPRKHRKLKLMRRASSEERISELQFRKGFVMEEEDEETTSFGSSTESVHHIRPRDRPSRPMSHIALKQKPGLFGIRKK
ncbi:uncharacterized protein [Lepeophtheirus salmonis]|uniref:uncharacterized protein isoform X1 n=1 Tax=Lepeophtheirus salmonis TaxID=72036 RepID=UPI001AE43B9C|nr:uncharacterized protein LOC121114023 isoform X1 [Lepeophtheirus salmonis]